jgi:gliding motility-associated-like protein
MRARLLPIIFFTICLCFFVNEAQGQIATGPVSGTISSCVGTASFSPNLQQFTLTGTGLSANITATAPAGFEISGSPTVAFNSVITWVQTGGNVNAVVYVRAAASAPVGNISGNVVFTSIGIASASVGVTGTVNALPTVNPVANQTITGGSPTTAVNFTGTGRVYNWTNNTPGIGLAASGTGDIPPFTAINTGSTAITATVTVTPKPAGYVYTADQGSNTVSILNTFNYIPEGSIPVGLNPLKTIVSPGGLQVYVINQQSNTVSIIDVATRTVAFTIPVGVSPMDMQLTPDGSKLYVINTGSATVSVINTATKSVTTTIGAGQFPQVSVMSPDGNHLYVNDRTAAKVLVINTTTNQIESTINGIVNVINFTFNQDGSRLYVVDGDSNIIRVINTATSSLITSIPVGTRPIQAAITPDGQRLYVANTLSNNVSVINTITNSVIATIPVGQYVMGIVITPDGKYLYTTGRITQDASLINTATNAVITTIPLSGTVGNPVLNLDGSRLYVSDGGNVVLVINTATNGPPAHTPAGLNPVIQNNQAISAGTGCTGAPITFTITVNPPPPTINVVGAPLAVTTDYGTASIPGSFSLAGSNLTGPVTVTPPAGFEVSTDNINFSPTLIIPAAGNLASTMIYSRLAGTTNAGTYAGNIVLSSPGAASVNVAIPNSTVNRRIMNITGTFVKTYGSVLNNVTLFYNMPDVTFNNTAFQNGNSFNSIDLTFSVGTAANSLAGAYPGTVTMSNLTGRNGYLSSNYTVNYAPVDLVVLRAPLTITINKVTKPYGAALTNTTGSTDFTVTGLKNGETVGSVSVSYGTGASATAAAGTYTGSVVASLVTGGTFLPANYNITYLPAEIEVTPPLPVVITVAGNPQPVNTVYGTPSAPANFSVTAANLLSGVVVTPPPGFEVSKDNVTFSSTITIGSVGSITSAPVYIRLAAITNVGSYSGNIVLNSGTTTVNVAMPNSTVSRAPLTLAANTETKNYGDVLTDVSNSNKFTITAGSLKNGNTLTGVLLSYGSGKAATAGVSVYKDAVTIVGVNGGNGFLVSNYDLHSTTADIKVLPVSLAIVANSASKTYGETLNGGPGSILFTATGLKNGETVGSVTLTYTAGAAATDNVANYAGKITPADPVGGTFAAGNYIISYTAGDLTVAPAPLTISAVDVSRNYGTVKPVLTVTYTGFVNGDTETSLTKQPTIVTTATIASDGGKYPITASGAGALNYTITYVDGVLTVIPPVDLVIPNSFTPNHDGINDTWRIPALASYPNSMIEIFNRYGTKVYSATGYGTPWDGTAKGSDVPVGVYYYIIDTKVIGIKATGSLTVIR